MASAFHQQRQVAGSSSRISLTKNIGGKAAYCNLSQTPQKWELYALDTTSFFIWLQMVFKSFFYR